MTTINITDWTHERMSDYVKPLKEHVRVVVFCNNPTEKSMDAFLEFTRNELMSSTTIWFVRYILHDQTPERVVEVSKRKSDSKNLWTKEFFDHALTEFQLSKISRIYIVHGLPNIVEFGPE